MLYNDPSQYVSTSEGTMTVMVFKNCDPVKIDLIYTSRRPLLGPEMEADIVNAKEAILAKIREYANVSDNVLDRINYELSVCPYFIKRLHDRNLVGQMTGICARANNITDIPLQDHKVVAETEDDGFVTFYGKRIEKKSIFDGKL